VPKISFAYIFILTTVVLKMFVSQGNVATPEMLLIASRATALPNPS